MSELEGKMAARGQSQLPAHMPAGHFGRPASSSRNLGDTRPSRSEPLSITEIVRARARLSAFKGMDLSAPTMASLGLTLPGPGTFVAAANLQAIWLQPGVWLFETDEAEGPALLAKLAEIANGKAAVLDETDARSTLRVQGANARNALAKGCRIDLHPRAFGPGRVAITPIAHVPVILAQLDATPTFDLTVASTFAVHLLEWLETSCAELGYQFGARAG